MFRDFPLNLPKLVSIRRKEVTLLNPLLKNFFSFVEFLALPTDDIVQRSTCDMTFFGEDRTNSLHIVACFVSMGDSPAFVDQKLVHFVWSINVLEIIGG